LRHVAELGALPTLRIALAALLVTAISIGSEPSDPPGLGPHPLRRAAATPSPAPAAAPPTTTSAPSPRRTPTPTASPPSPDATA
ncbi:unnamed protein product, partial [Musa hybrid cultivar]